MELSSQIKALHNTERQSELKLIQCPECHLILAPDSHFCNNCGQKIFRKTKKILTEAENRKKTAAKQSAPGQKTEATGRKTKEEKTEQEPAKTTTPADTATESPQESVSAETAPKAEPQKETVNTKA